MYYSKLADRYRRNQIIVRFALTLSAMGSISSAISDRLPTGVEVFADVSIAVFVAWDIIANYTKKMYIVNTIRDDLMGIEADWRRLWSDVYYQRNTIRNNTEIQETVRQYSIRVNEVVSKKNMENIRTSNRLNKKCEKLAFKNEEARYAVETT